MGAVMTEKRKLLHLSPAEDDKLQHDFNLKIDIFIDNLEKNAEEANWFFDFFMIIQTGAYGCQSFVLTPFFFSKG